MIADLDDMLAWSRGKLQLPPDFVIGDDYLRRWWVIPRNPYANVYLHEILHSDEGRDFIKRRAAALKGLRK